MNCYCHCNDIVLVAYAPFASPGYVVSSNLKPPFEHPVIIKIAKEIQCKPAQVTNNFNEVIY